MIYWNILNYQCLVSYFNSMPSTDSETYKGLRLIHIFLAFFHFAQGALTLLLSQDLVVVLTTSFLQYNSATRDISPMVEEVMSAPVHLLAIGVVLVAGTYHSVVASPLLYKSYITKLEQRMNPYRWLEYSFTASLIVSIVGLLTGVFDIFLQISLFVLCAGMMIYAYMFEQLNVRRQYGEPVNWVPFWSGLFLGSLPWAIIFSYYLSAVHDYQGWTSIWSSVVFSIFLTYALSMLNMFFTVKNWTFWKDYVFSEKIFLLLSVTAKTLLLWQIYFGRLF
jgi:hypothetical protein